MKFPILAAATLALTTAAHAAPPTDAELAACLGPTSNFLTAFEPLKKGMTPAEVAAVFPEADKLDKYEFAKVKPKDCAGATVFELQYMTDKKTGKVELHGVAITFDKALTRDKDFYKRLTTLLIAKYGPLKDEAKSLEKRLLTWGTTDGVVQLTAITEQHSLRLRGPVPKK